MFGLPDERLGEVVGAAVWLQPGEQAVTADELSETAKQIVAKFKAGRLAMWRLRDCFLDIELY